LILAFPAELARDAEAVLAVMPASPIQPLEPFSVSVEGQQVSIPGRLYNDEPLTEAVASLSSRQRQLLHCLYSRHCDGMVRQRHLAEVVDSAEPWVVPFVVQLVGEYVLEILVVIRDELRDLATPGTRSRLVYGQFIVENPAFFARTQRRVVSYWSCYYRSAYATFRGYPGCSLLDLLRSAASDRAGHPWPDYDSARTRNELDDRGLHGQIAHKGEKAPIQASQRWHIERTHAWQNAFHRLARCYERRATVITPSSTSPTPSSPSAA
jgi:transposase